MKRFRTTRLKLFVVYGSAVTMLGCVMAACASLVGVEDGILETDSGADGTVDSRAPDATVGAGDSSADSGLADARTDAADSARAGDSAKAGDSAGSADSADAEKDVGAPLSDAAACEAQAVDAGAGLFVVAGGSMNSASCGSMGQPCGTVQLGLDRAAMLGRSIVYVAEATYTEALTLHPAVTLQGGWSVVGTDWSPICTTAADQAVTIAAPAGAAVTVLADTLGGTATLQTLHVASAAMAAPSQSLYGIVARGATTALVLDDVVVDMATGGAGDAGTAPAAPPTATGTCAAGTGGVGAVGSVGPASDGGAFAASGYAPGPGSAGTTGGPGNAGVAGGAPTCVACVTSVGCGGTLVCNVLTTAQSCGDAGASGCGGAGGGAGGGGNGGGSSIALYVWDAQVTCSGGSLAGGAGGGGGNGGHGGASGAGSPGQTGASQAACNTGVSIGLCARGCAGDTPATPTGGDAGGAGGRGGAGGAGGGGSGGWSCAYYVGGNGAVTAGVTTTLAHATAGPGGLAGGAPGVAKDQCP